MTDYDYERIVELAGKPDAEGWAFVTIDVKKDETAWNPASIKHVIYGPAKVRYEIHKTGVRGVIL